MRRRYVVINRNADVTLGSRYWNYLFVIMITARVTCGEICTCGMQVPFAHGMRIQNLLTK